MISWQYIDGPGTRSVWQPYVAIWTSVVTRVVVEDHISVRGYVGLKCDSMTYVSCYFTSNESFKKIKEKLDHLDKLGKGEEPQM